MITDVTGARCADSELRVVGGAVGISLGAIVAPKAIRCRRSLAVEQGVSVLHFQQALVRPIHIGVIRLLIE